MVALQINQETGYNVGMSYWKELSQPYKPGQKTAYRVSRSKIELFMQCQRCFWLDVRLKITRPNGPPFNINKAIDELFKKEFDYYRAKNIAHPLMLESAVDAVPYSHKQLNKWRRALGDNAGIDIIHKPTNLHLFGAVDDVWIDKSGQLIIVDYKATAKTEPVKALGPEGSWHDMYRRQMEIYQWLFKQNGFKVNDTGYFVYATGSWAHDRFDNVVKFETHIFGHHGNSDWVDKTILEMKQVMDNNTMPPVGVAAMGGSCDFCSYARKRTEQTLDYLKKRQ